MSTAGDEQERQLASSPPPSWEDRAELMPEEQPFGVSWMETGMQDPWLTHLVQNNTFGLVCRCRDHGRTVHHFWLIAADEGGDKGGGQESPPTQTVTSSQPSGSSTPDLLADTPPQQQPPPDDDRLDLAMSRPQRLFRGRSSPRSNPHSHSPRSTERSPLRPVSLPGAPPAHAAVASSSTTSMLAQRSEGSVPGAGAGQSPAAALAVVVPAPAKAAAPEGEADSPRGCYSTLAAHERGPQEGSLGHELPSCFGSTEPNMRISSPPRPGTHARSPHGDAASDHSLGTRRSREASPEATARSTSPVKEAEKGTGQRSASVGPEGPVWHPLGVSSRVPLGCPPLMARPQNASSRAKPGGSQHDNGKQCH